jgi:CubicO group peptidase (beta-lactamase class C family)
MNPAVEAAVARLDIPGVAIGVVDRGKPRTWCAGVTGFEHPLPVTETTIFQIGSISKTFTGTAAMTLVDDGVLDLDTPIVKYVPGLRLSSDELTASVTLRHLFTHTGGWVGDYFKDTGEGDDALARFVAKLAKAPQLTPLGSTYSYSNSAFNLAAHVVATAAGIPFERVVHDRVSKPLGMGATTYAAQSAIGRRIAVGHRNGEAQPWLRPRAHNGGGGVLSCVDDLLKYAEFHLAHRSDMQVTQRAAGSLCDEVGIVWMIDHHAGHRVVHHGGTTNGYQADLRLVPDRDLAWVMLTNCDHHHQLDRVLLDEFLGRDTTPLAANPEDLSEYCGKYEAILAELTIAVDGDTLRADVGTPEKAAWNAGEDPGPPVPTRLAFRDADRVVAMDDPWTGHRGEFVRDSAGAIEWFRWDGRLARRT